MRLLYWTLFIFNVAAIFLQPLTIGIRRKPHTAWDVIILMIMSAVAAFAWLTVLAK